MERAPKLKIHPFVIATLPAKALAPNLEAPPSSFMERWNRSKSSYQMLICHTTYTYIWD